MVTDLTKQMLARNSLELLSNALLIFEEIGLIRHFELNSRQFGLTEDFPTSKENMPKI
jgi:hypothetical protein